MKNIVHFFIIIGTVFSISFCSNSEDTTGIRVSHGDFTLILQDSLQSGLNLIKVESNKKASYTLQVAENGLPIPFIQSNDTLLIPVINPNLISFQLNQNEIDLPLTSKSHDFNLQNDSNWVSIFSPKTGLYGFQALVFAHFQKQDSVWVQSNKIVQFIPWMNMRNGYGHGSQFNVQPELIDTLGATLNRGTVAFSMPGTWELRFIIDSDTLITSIPVKNKN